MVDDEGRTPEHRYTISSHCEPNGSGELKRDFFTVKKYYVLCVYVVLRSDTPEYPYLKWPLLVILNKSNFKFMVIESNDFAF